MPLSSAPIGYIYLVTNLMDGKKYVGLTKLIPKRWGEHRSAAKNGSQYPLHRAMRKHGQHNFVVECLETVTTNRADLLAAEIRQIAAHGCIAPKGYNLTSGGEGVDISVPGVLERMREGAKKRSSDPVWRKNVAKAAVRRAADPEVRARLVEGCRKRSANPSYKKAHAEGIRVRSLAPGWKESMAAGAQTRAENRSTNPEVQARFEEGYRKRSANQAYRKANDAALSKAWAAHSAKAAARDAHLPIEEQERRARKRERDRVNAARAYAKSKALSTQGLQS